jgi:hypothetical protein
VCEKPQRVMDNMETEAIVPTTEPNVNWEARAVAAENEAQYYRNQVDDLQLNLEIANERWVTAVNDLAATEVKLRKLQRTQN